MTAATGRSSALKHTGRMIASAVAAAWYTRRPRDGARDAGRAGAGWLQSAAMRRLAPLCAALVLLCGCPPCLQSGVDDCATLRAVNPAGLRATAWLLDEESFGRRDAPSPGAVRAAHYLAAQMQAAGLQPGGDNGTFLQEVPLTIVEPRKPALALIQGDVEVTLAPERDFHLLEAHGDAQVKVDAELVIADGAGAAPVGPVRGRVALVTVRAPDEAPRAATAVTALRRQGAAGVLLCTRGPGGRDAYHKLRVLLQRPVVRPAQAPSAANKDAAGQHAARLVVALAPPACEQLLATAAVARRGPATSPVLPVRVRGQARLEPKPARAWNAVGIVPTTRNPAAPPVLVMARLDGPGVNLAALIEVGRALVQLKARAPRPVMLVGMAASPEGPLGLAQLRTHACALGAAHLHVTMDKLPAERVPVETARLIEGILRGAARTPAP